jgi:hypothetical protein
MSLGKRYKDADETRLFTFDWSAHLGGETINTALVIASTGITVDAFAKTEDEKGVSALISGGTAGNQYTVTCTITITATNEELERSGIVAVRQL